MPGEGCAWEGRGHTARSSPRPVHPARRPQCRAKGGASRHPARCRARHGGAGAEPEDTASPRALDSTAQGAEPGDAPPSPRRAGRRRSPRRPAAARSAARARERAAVDSERGRARAPSGRRAGRQAAAAPGSCPAPRDADRRPRLSRGRRRRAGSGPGPCARYPDDAARPPGARPGPGPVARGAGGGPRARLRALCTPLSMRPGTRRRLSRQLLRPRTADARARAAHPRGRHHTVSNPPPRDAGREVAMAPGGREDWGAVRAWRGAGRGEASPRLHPPGRGPAGQAAGLAGLAGRGRVPGL